MVAVLGIIAVPRLEKAGYNYEYFMGSSTATVVVKPTNTYDFDKTIPPLFNKDNKGVAPSLTGLFAGIADRLASDGSRQDPRIKYVANINDLRLESISVAFNGKKINELVPRFGDVVGPVFAKEFPDGTAELDATLRAKAVELFRALSYGCSVVSK